MSKYDSFTELEVWKKSRLFRNSMFKLCQKFPNEEKFKLKDQLIRCSRSITANISEGHGRFHFQENIQFCRIARGSLAESLDHLICAFDCNYINENELLEYKAEINEITKILNGYINYLKRAKQKN